MAADINLTMPFQWEGKKRGAGNLDPAVWPRQNVTQTLSVTFVNLMSVDSGSRLQGVTFPIREYGARSIPGGGAINAIEIDAGCERLLKITYIVKIDCRKAKRRIGGFGINWQDPRNSRSSIRKCLEGLKPEGRVGGMTRTH